MASKKNGAGAKVQIKRQLPAGFVEARQRLDGFFERVKGNQAIGVLRGSFAVKGKFGTKNVFRIELTDGETQVSDGEMLGAGSTIGLDETGYTKVLGEIPNGSTVFVRYEGKGDSKDSPHVFTVGKMAE